MRLSRLGEIGLITRLARNFKTGGSVIKGIGDDCAVIRLSKDKHLLVTIDMLLEDVDFISRDTSPFCIGWKSLACGLSDIAAMGGDARYAVISLGLPRKLSVEFIEGIYKGIKAVAHKFGIQIIGGDTNSSKKLVIDIAVLGCGESRRTIFRNGAKVGDIICVTGTLGGSYKSGRHLKFTPRLKEAKTLVKNFKINSMIDVSDGLSTDLTHIADESKVGACVYEEVIPVSKDAKDLKAALNEGEDFELLFTMPVGEARRLAENGLRGIKIPITQIGEILDEGCGVNIISKAGKVTTLRPKGFSHF